MNKNYFWPEPETVILHDGNFDGTKISLHPSLSQSVDWNGFGIYFQLCEKSATSWKKVLKIQKIFSLILVLKKSRAKKLWTSLLA